MAPARRYLLANVFEIRQLARRGIREESFHYFFILAFDEQEAEPVADQALRDYILELDDATKVMHNQDGRPLNFGAMPDEQFLEVREHVESGQIEKILDM